MTYRDVRVDTLARPGIRQFLDLGAGLPTEGNVHEIAHQVAPDARVVYVDYDRVVVVHGQALLTGTDKTGVVQADLRQPREVLSHPEVTGVLDFGQPMAVLLIASLHLLTETPGAGGRSGGAPSRAAAGAYRRPLFSVRCLDEL